MAKKTRKVLKHESQQRAIQQAVANINTLTSSATEPVSSAAAPASLPRTAKLEISDEQEFVFVKSDVRRSLTLAAIFTAAMVALSFVLR
jgi:hypothetical protein